MRRFFLTVTLTFPVFVGGIPVADSAESVCPGGSSPDPAVIWCDDFDEGTLVRRKYFEYNDKKGDFLRLPGVGLNGTHGMRVKWQRGESEAGNLKRSFGRIPAGLRSQSHHNQDFREIFWRQYLKMESGWTGQPRKLSRAMIFAKDNTWAQAMIAHLWGSKNSRALGIDPATGIDKNNNLVTTKYNDFSNLRWLGIKRGVFPLFNVDSSGKWYCIEAHVKLNTPGLSDGMFEYWIDNSLQAESYNLNWVGTWQDYGINAVFFENYWNEGAPGERIRYIDNIVISTKRIGCVGD